MVFPTADNRLPPGVRFHPTDEELIVYYLKRKVLGKSIRGDAVSELDIYGFAPWDLPKLGSLRSRNLTGYFFCPRLERCGNSRRAHRLTKSGFWKATGNDRSVQHKGRLVGKIKTLIFHLGNSHNGERKDWVMYEFRLVDPHLNGVVRDSYVLCKVFEKSGLGPKNGEQYGAPFIEEEWEEDDGRETQGIPASTSLTGGPSGCNNQEDSAVTGIFLRDQHNSGIVASLCEQVSLGNGALSSVDLPDPNACRDVVPIPEGPQGQSPVSALDDGICLEEVLEPYINRTDAGVLAHGTGLDQSPVFVFDGGISPEELLEPYITRTDAGGLAHGTGQDQSPVSALDDWICLEEVSEPYINRTDAGVLAHGTGQDQSPVFVFDGGISPEEVSEPYINHTDAGGLAQGTGLDQSPVFVFYGGISPEELLNPYINRTDAGGLAHGTGLDQSPVSALDDWICLEEVSEPYINRTDAGVLSHGTGQDQVMQDADNYLDAGVLAHGTGQDQAMQDVYCHLEPLIELPYLSHFNNAGYAPQVDVLAGGDFLEQRDLDDWLPP